MDYLQPGTLLTVFGHVWLVIGLVVSTLAGVLVAAKAAEWLASRIFWYYGLYEALLSYAKHRRAFEKWLASNISLPEKNG